MRSIGNAWSALGQTPPTLRRGHQTALVVASVAAIAATSVFSSLSDATATNPAALFAPVRAMLTTFAPAPTAEEKKQAATSPPMTAPAVREPSASPAKQSRQVERKPTVWNEREWWKDDRQKRSRNVYWPRSAHARVWFPGSISSER